MKNTTDKKPASPDDVTEVVNIFKRLPEAAKSYFTGVGHGLLAGVETRDEPENKKKRKRKIA